MPGDEPDDHEQAEEDVANQPELEIFEHFRELNGQSDMQISGKVESYRKQDVHNIHQTQNGVSNFGLMITVASEDQDAGNNMMREHLGIVFPALFDVDYQDLLQIKCKLHEVIPLGETAHFPIRPIGPHLTQVEPVLGIVH